MNFAHNDILQCAATIVKNTVVYFTLILTHVIASYFLVVRSKLLTTQIPTPRIINYLIIFLFLLQLWLEYRTNSFHISHYVNICLIIAVAVFVVVIDLCIALHDEGQLVGCIDLDHQVAEPIFVYGSPISVIILSLITPALNEHQLVCERHAHVIQLQQADFPHFFSELLQHANQLQPLPLLILHELGLPSEPIPNAGVLLDIP